MANPAAAVDPHMPAAFLQLRNGIELANRRRAGARHRLRRRRVVRPQLMIIANTAVFLVSAAGSIVIYYSAADPSGGTGTGEDEDTAFALLAFLLTILGLWLAMLHVVADPFPRAAIVGEAIARALRGYFLGGGRRGRN